MTLRDFIFSFQPHKKGLTQILGDLEAPIMSFLWDHGPASVRHVHQHLRADQKIAYTTVMTIMSRLAEKGLLERRKEGQAFVYSATVSREDFAASTLSRIFSSLLGEWGTPAVSTLLDSVGEDPARMEELARLIEAKKAEESAR